MNILITTSTFPYREGDGQARFILDLATALSERNEVTVLAPHIVGGARAERIGKLKVRRFRYFLPEALQRLAYGSGMRHNLESSRLAALQIPFFLLAQALAVASLAVKESPAVINAHWLVPQGVTSALVARLFRIPLVVHVHAADVYFLRRFKLGAPLAKFVVRSSAAVLADGSHVRDSLDEMIGFPSSAKLRPMGVWLDVFQDDQDVELGPLPGRFVLFVGRLVEKKGVEYLIRAMPRVRESVGDVQLVIVGEGHLGPQLEALSSRLQLQEVVHFLGSKPQSVVAGMLHRAEVVSVPSIIDSRGETEGMPTVVLEAMASGARVVGSRVNGIPDVLQHSSNGWLVEPKDEASLAKGLILAITDPGAHRIAEAGASTAAQHDWPQVVAEYGRVLEEVARA